MQSSGVSKPTRGIEKGHLHLDTTTNKFFTYVGGDPKDDSAWEEGIVKGIEIEVAAHDTEEQLKVVRVQVTALEERCRVLEGIHQETLGKLIVAETSRDNAQKEFERIQTLIVSKEREIIRLQSELGNAQGQLNLAGEQQLRDQVFSAQQEAVDLQIKLNRANEEIQTRIKEAETAKNKVGELDTELGQLKHIQSVTATNLKNIQDRLSEQININTQQNHTIGTLKDKIRKLEPMEEQLKDRESVIKGLEQEKDQHTNEIISLRDLVRLQEHQVKVAETQAKNLKDQAVQVESLMIEVNQLRTQIESVTKAADEQQRRDLSRLEKLEGEKIQAEANMMAVQIEFNTVRTKQGELIAELKSALTVKETALLSVIEDARQSHARVEQLTKELAEKNKIEESVKKEIQRMIKQMDALPEELIKEFGLHDQEKETVNQSPLDLTKEDIDRIAEKGVLVGEPVFYAGQSVDISKEPIVSWWKSIMNKIKQIQKYIDSKDKHVIAWGRDTYLRLYPNPGVGICYQSRRIAASIKGGIEIFKKQQNGSWQRTHAWFTRIKRPGSVK